MVGQPLMSTPEYLELEMKEVAKCQDLFQRIIKYEALHPVSLKVTIPFPAHSPYAGLLHVDLNGRSFALVNWQDTPTMLAADSLGFQGTGSKLQALCYS